MTSVNVAPSITRRNITIKFQALNMTAQAPPVLFANLYL